MTQQGYHVDRRKLLSLVGTGALGAAAGCAVGGGGGGSGGGGSGGGGGTTSGDSDFQAELSKIDFTSNWEERMTSSFDAWPMDVREKIPAPENQGSIDAWANCQAVKEADWEPPAGWEDSLAGGVDTVQKLNFGSLQYDPATVATYGLLKDRTGITVDNIEVVVDQAIPKEAAYFSSKASSPHMQSVSAYSSISSFAQNGYLEPVDQIVPDSVWNSSTYLPIMQNSFNVGGHLYGGPNNIEGGVVHGRPDLLKEQVGQDVVDKFTNGTWTWDDLETVMKAFEGTGKFGWAYRGGSMTYTVWDWKRMLYQAGGSIVQDNGKVNVTTDAAVHALEKMVEWREKGWVPKEVNSYGQGDLSDGFLSGQFVLAPVATDLVTRAVQQYTPGEQYTIYVVGKGDQASPNPQRANFAATVVETLNKFAPTDKKVASTLYQDARYSYATQWFEYVVEGNMSYMNPVYEDAGEVLRWPKVRQKSMQVAKTDVYPQQRAISQRLSSGLQEAIAGSTEPKKALQSAQDYVNTVLGY